MLPPLPPAASNDNADDLDDNVSVLSLRDLTNVPAAVAEKLKFMGMSIDDKVAHLASST